MIFDRLVGSNKMTSYLKQVSLVLITKTDQSFFFNLQFLAEKKNKIFIRKNNPTPLINLKEQN